MGPSDGALKGDVGCAGYELAKNAMKNRDNTAQAAATQEFNGVEEQMVAKRSGLLNDQVGASARTNR